MVRVFSAQEARDLAERQRDIQDEEFFKSVLEDIKDSALKGYYKVVSLWSTKHLEIVYSVIRKLNNLGYETKLETSDMFLKYKQIKLTTTWY